VFTDWLLRRVFSGDGRDANRLCLSDVLGARRIRRVRRSNGQKRRRVRVREPMQRHQNGDRDEPNEHVLTVTHDFFLFLNALDVPTMLLCT
jgi:hypothetical protein